MEKITKVMVRHQKILFRGRTLNPESHVTLGMIGVRMGEKLMVLGKVTDPENDEVCRVFIKVNIHLFIQ